MLNYLWAGMIIVGIVYAACTGNIVEVTNAALDSSREAITLCITMAGVMAFWTGLMEIARRGGMIRALTGRMAPVLKFLPFSRAAGRTSGKGTHCNELYRQCAGAWLGGYAGRA